jgi:RHS repeat-associated protein
MRRLPSCTSALLWLSLVVLSTVALSAVAHADKPEGVTAQTLSLPSGPTSLKGLGESFSPNVATGTGSYSVPIEVPPGFLAPKVSLDYAGGAGKGVLGMGWNLPLLQVYRSTDKGAPNFDGDDRFSVSGPGLNDELVRVDAQRRLYRLKNEGSFVLFEHDFDPTSDRDQWLLSYPDGQTAVLGATPQARETSTRGTYRWLLSTFRDRFGTEGGRPHETRYEYFEDAGRVYLERVVYQTHASEALQNEVIFEHEARPDVFTDYSYGDACTTRLRLRAIRTLHGGSEVRAYTLQYQNTLLFSQLIAVRLTAGGLSLPELRFGYVRETERSGAFVIMRDLPPLEGLFDGSAQLDDVSGDGLPDLLVARADQYHYYENLDGRHWAQAPIPLDGSPDRSLYDDGVLLVDVNGDGFRDLLHPQGAGFRYYPAGQHEEGKLLGFEAPLTLQGQLGMGVHFGSSDVKLTDLNHDGRIDLLWQKPGQDAAVLNQADALREERIAELPLDVDFRDPRLQLTDINGDGMLDFVLKDIRETRARMRIWYGLGHGEYTAEQEMFGVPTGNPDEFYLEDVNGDGQTDLLRISGSWATYYLNDGQLRFTQARGDFYGLPSPARTRKILFADMNGNGSQDIVWLTDDDKLSYFDLRGDPFAGLLETIDNGMGLVTTMTYRSSTDYAIAAKRQGRPWKHPMRSPVPVLASLRSSDSFDKLGFAATVTETTFDYRDGYFDAKEREFRGFGLVTMRERGDAYHEGLTTESYFHVGRNPETGEDEEILKGRPYLQVLRDEAGAVLSTVQTRWKREWLCQEDLVGVTRTVLPRCRRFTELDAHKDDLVAFAEQVDVVQGAWEGVCGTLGPGSSCSGMPRFSATHVEFDDWGSPVKSIAYGEIKLTGPPALGEIPELDPNDRTGADEAVSTTKYINDVERWLLRIPYENAAEDIGGQVLRRTQKHYDGAPFVGLALGQVTRGLVTRERAWLDTLNGGAGGWVDASRSAYNSHGQLVAKRDAEFEAGLSQSKGGEVEYAYDEETGYFLTEERVRVDSGWVRFSARYNTALGTIRESTDPNDQVTRYEHDALSRLRRVIGPEDSADHPLVDYTYEYGTREHPVSRTTTRQLVDRARHVYHTTLSYSDGSGATRQTKAESEGDYGYVATGWVQHSVRGKPALTYRPFDTASSELEEPPADTPVETVYYDALSRKTQVYLPQLEQLGPAYSVTQYLPFEVRTYDEGETSVRNPDGSQGNWLHPVIVRVDGRERLVEVEKTNEVDGREQKLVWRVGYDAVDQIRTLRDPKWNENAPSAERARSLRQYAYDSLGRQIGLSDPNLGSLSYAYDLVGNLVRRTDALGQRMEWEYGLANRLALRRTRGSVEGLEDAVYRLHYDAPDPQSPVDVAHLNGRLAWVEFPTGTEHYSYDRYGRLEVEAHQLWNPILSNVGNQSRDLFVQRTSYAADDVVVGVQAPGGLAVSLAHNVRRLVETVTAGFGGADRGVEVARAIAYNERGQPVAGVSGNGLNACWRYDDRGQLVRSFVGNATCSPRGPPPDNAGLMNLRYTRTHSGRLQSVSDLTRATPSVPRLDASYAYDAVGQLIRASDSVASFRFTYDEIQNLVSRELISGSTAAPTGTFTYGEDGAGPSAISAAGAQRYSYDDLGQLENYNGFGLTFNPEGQLVEARREGKVIAFHYDAWGQRRIATVVEQGAPSRVQRFVTDGYELREQSHETGDVETEELWSVSSPLGMTEIRRADGIDVDASLLAQLRDYAEGRGTDLKPLVAEYMDLDRDGDAVFDQDDVAEAERALLTHRKAGGRREVWSYHHQDPLGATTHITDSTGALVSMQTFHPYGVTSWRRGAKVSVGFAGSVQEIDADLGLLYFGSRYYAPALGRWVSPDRAIGESPQRMLEHVLESSLYNYAANDPIGRKDPTGQSSLPSGEQTDAFVNGMKRAGAALASETGKELLKKAAYAWIPGGQVLAAAEMAYDAVTAVGDLIDALEHAGESIDKLVAMKDRLLAGEGTVADFEALGTLAVVVGAMAVGVGLGKILKKTNLKKILGGGGCPSSCFIAGTLVALSAQADAVPIEQIEVGDRVVTIDSTLEAPTEVDEEHWRLVELRLFTEGKVVDIETLRPRWWLEAVGAEPGATIELGLEELRIGVGTAEVLAVRPCPPIEQGPGHVVLSTFSHVVPETLRLRFAESDEVLELTADHRLFSIDRQDWVAADALAVGEQLRVAQGEAHLASIEVQAAPQRVYNIEVETEHSYLVSELGLLGHNSKPCPTTRVGQTRHVELKPAQNGQYRVDFDSGKVYVGKGGTGRARKSARQRSREHSDPVKDIVHNPADNDAEAFRLEAEELERYGGPGSSSNYNAINSPGEKKREKQK